MPRVEIEDGRFMDSEYFETPVMALDSIPPDCPDCGNCVIGFEGCRYPKAHEKMMAARQGRYPVRRRVLDEYDFWVGFLMGVFFRSIFRSK